MKNKCDAPPLSGGTVFIASAVPNAPNVKEQTTGRDRLHRVRQTPPSHVDTDGWRGWHGGWWGLADAMKTVPTCGVSLKNSPEGAIILGTL